jgi:hypothetical protein
MQVVTTVVAAPRMERKVRTQTLVRATSFVAKEGQLLGTPLVSLRKETGIFSWFGASAVRF